MGIQKMKKITELVVQRVGVTTAHLNKKSQNIIKTFTDAINEIDDVNERVDLEVEETTKIINEFKREKHKLVGIKEANNKIKEKIKSIIE